MAYSFETDPASSAPLRWSDPLNITWSIATSNYSGQAVQFSHSMVNAQATFENIIKSAFQTWSSVANVKFTEVTDSSTVDIRFGFEDLILPTLGRTNYYELNGNFQPGRVTIGLTDPADGAPLTGPISATAQWKGYIGTIQQVLTHEIGHALGLGHDTTDQSAMMYPTSSTLNETLDSSDILGIQALYGRATTTKVVSLTSGGQVRPAASLAFAADEGMSLDDFPLPQMAQTETLSPTGGGTHWDSNPSVVMPPVYESHYG